MYPLQVVDSLTLFVPHRSSMSLKHHRGVLVGFLPYRSSLVRPPPGGRAGSGASSSSESQRGLEVQVQSCQLGGRNEDNKPILVWMWVHLMLFASTQQVAVFLSRSEAHNLYVTYPFCTDCINSIGKFLLVKRWKGPFFKGEAHKSQFRRVFSASAPSRWLYMGS